MEGYERKDEVESKDEIFSKAVRAGKRTYFFDVKSTKKNDFYLTITESKKRINKDGRFYFEKHKMFLYKEDFEKFSEGLSEVIDYIKSILVEENTNFTNGNFIDSSIDDEIEEFTNVEFEDLER